MAAFVFGRGASTVDDANGPRRLRDLPCGDRGTELLERPFGRFAVRPAHHRDFAGIGIAALNDAHGRPFDRTSARSSGAVSGSSSVSAGDNGARGPNCSIRSAATSNFTELSTQLELQLPTANYRRSDPISLSYFDMITSQR